ncbi:MAG: hypothetical protein KDD61_16885, partial [Bdellovibrionales bacterium]|nr:hypothetical protein [Bdellovibrionales bacterium]
MVHLLIGHRGVGKTHFLRRIEAYYREFRQQVICLDLDTEIEKFQQCSISEIFRSMGEGVFREMEQDVLNNLMELYGEENCDVYIALGAGYQGEIPKDANVIWVRRDSDDQGRTLLSRPRLVKEGSGYQEYLSKYQERRTRYISICSEEFCIEEGFEQINSVEPLFLGLTNGSIQGCLSLLPENFLNKKHWKKFLKKRLKWGVRYFELRDDYLSEEMLKLALATVPRSHLLLSFRDPKAQFFKGLDLSLFTWDWPLELGDIAERSPSIVSLHERSSNQSVIQCGRKLERATAGRKIYLKLAVEVHDFQELAEGHSWWLEDPENRSFLPRSSEGRWQWYRLLHRETMSINFFREATGSQIDQPTLFQWCRFPKKSKGFAAILGNPVVHSWTPGFHQEFFLKLDLAVIRIPIRENEFTHETLEFLQALGLKAAAVTSPLKNTVAQIIPAIEKDIDQIGAINTIWQDKKSGKWWGTNTDLHGVQQQLAEAFEKFDKNFSWDEIAVWGGGGTRSVLKQALPMARFFS